MQQWQQMQQMQQMQHMQQMQQWQQMQNMLEQKEQNQSKKIIFKNNRDDQKTITTKYGTTIEELLNNYINQVNGFTNKKLSFLYNAKKIDRYDQSQVKDYFKYNDNPIVMVIGF